MYRKISLSSLGLNIRHVLQFKIVECKIHEKRRIGHSRNIYITWRSKDNGVRVMLSWKGLARQWHIVVFRISCTVLECLFTSLMLSLKAVQAIRKLNRGSVNVDIQKARSHFMETQTCGSLEKLGIKKWAEVRN